MYETIWHLQNLGLVEMLWTIEDTFYIYFREIFIGCVFISAGTPYTGGIFRMKLVLGKNFPNEPPKGFFLTKIFHPNVAKNGEICVNTLKKDWKAEVGIKHVLLVSISDGMSQHSWHEFLSLHVVSNKWYIALIRTRWIALGLFRLKKLKNKCATSIFKISISEFPYGEESSIVQIMQITNRGNPG